MLRASLLVVFSSLALAGCVAPPSPAQRLAESAYDLNTAARFGRMDVALEHVRENAREAFNKTHAGWGRTVRVVDCEMGSMSMRKDGDADVLLTVSWQRPDESSMRSTEIAQRWASKSGTWSMISEEERGGDPGLISELAKPKNDDAPAPPAPRPRYQTRVIYEQ
jgi:hypothetical protein